jgi:hypothetical protein
MWIDIMLSVRLHVHVCSLMYVLRPDSSSYSCVFMFESKYVNLRSVMRVCVCVCVCVCESFLYSCH